MFRSTRQLSLAKYVVVWCGVARGACALAHPCTRAGVALRVGSAARVLTLVCAGSSDPAQDQQTPFLSPEVHR